jgi:hypothetical protein
MKTTDVAVPNRRLETPPPRPGGRRPRDRMFTNTVWFQRSRASRFVPSQQQAREETLARSLRISGLALRLCLLRQRNVSALT